MRELKQTLLRNFNNIPLRRKLVSLILVCILLVTSISFLGIQIIQRTEHRLLYQALLGSLTYAANDIEENLRDVETVSNGIISNRYVSRDLMVLADDKASEVAKNNARSSLVSTLFDYQQNNRGRCITHIAIDTEDELISSYDSHSNAVPREVREDVKAAAAKNSGYTCWVTDYADSYGLYLSRDIRRIGDMKIDVLGTLIIGIDMEKLIHTSTQSILVSDEAYFTFYKEDELIYTARDLNIKSPRSLREEIDGSYAVLNRDGSSYFCLKGSMENTEWDYVCLIPYNDIARTLLYSLIAALVIVLATAGAAILLARKIITSITGHFSSLVYKMDEFGRDESVLPATDYDYTERQDEIGQLHNRFDSMAQKIQQLIQENYVNEILAKDAKLKALENQINPHFLYNTLESVNWRAKASGEKEISTMVEALGSLLRTTLGHKSTTCTLSHELDIVRHYIAIQKLRFEERLDYTEEIDPNILSAELPQMCIQPLVENAINYVLEEVAGTCEIRIQGLIDGDRILVRIINVGSQFEENMLEKLEQGIIVPRGFGIGILNIHKRIQIVYGPAYGLSLYNGDEDHAVAQISIPRRDL